MRNYRLAGLLIVAFMFSVAQAEDWPQWRGPHFNGSSDAKGLPEKIDPAHPAWSADLPGPGSGTPVVWGDRIFVSCVDASSKKLLAMCLSRADGKVVWSKPVGLGFKQNNRNDTASPSAVTDGKTVWFYFGTGDLAAFDMQGNPVWSRNIQKDLGAFNILWIYSSSPMLYDGRLYLQVLQRDVPIQGPASGPPSDSYLLAVDPATGKDLWKQVRPNDAVAEAKESYATPIPYEHDGRAEILVVGADCVTAHDPKTGKELWRCGGWNPQKINHWRTVASVVAGDGLAFACVPKGGPVVAVRTGGQGDVTKTGVAWSSRQLSSDVCVPLFYKDHLYVLNGDKKELYCVDPKTGTVLWSGSLGGHSVFRASPTGADGKIYCVNEAGDVSIVSADAFKVLDKASLAGGRTHASVAVTDGEIFIRTGDKLFAFKG